MTETTGSERVLKEERRAGRCVGCGAPVTEWRAEAFDLRQLLARERGREDGDDGQGWIGTACGACSRRYPAPLLDACHSQVMGNARDPGRGWALRLRTGEVLTFYGAALASHGYGDYAHLSCVGGLVVEGAGAQIDLAQAYVRCADIVWCVDLEADGYPRPPAAGPESAGP